MNLRKTAFISGANRGIGKEIFISLIKNKFNAIVSVRKKTPVFENFISGLTLSKNQTIKVLEFDLIDHNQIKLEIQKLYKDKVVIDVLVNNAGKAHGALFEMTPISKLKEVFEVNFFSQLYLTQLLLRLMKKSNSGSIINIGSVSGILSEPGTIAYGSSKAALMFSSKLMANEFSKYKIRVNSIAPNITNTEMSEEMDIKSSNDLIERSFLKRKCTVKEISDLVLFLSSSQSSYINGQIFRIDGGMSG